MEKMDARAMVSIVAGIAALMFAGAVGRPLLTVVSLALGVLAVVTGLAVMRAGNKGMGVSVAGVVMGTIAVCVWILNNVYR